MGRIFTDSTFKSCLGLTVLMTLFLTGLTSCVKGAWDQYKTAPEKKKTVAVSIVPQETFVRAVAGDLVDTVVLIPPGYSPENYSPSPRELISLSEASLYFSIGVPAEKNAILAKLPDINKNIRVVDLAGETARVYAEREFSPGQRDHHIWLSPQRVGVMVDIIAQELSRTDPSNKEIYLKNAGEYKQKLADLDRKIKASLDGLAQRTFFVYHPSFGYFADDYGLNMVSVEKEGKETTIEDLKQVISLARQLQVKTLFYQAEVDSGQLQTVADEIGAKTIMIAPLAPDYLENMERIALALSQTD